MAILRRDENGNLISEREQRRLGKGGIAGQESLFVEDSELSLGHYSPSIIDMEESDPEEIALTDDVLELIRPGKFDIRNFMDDFENKSEMALNKLMSMQTNGKPLKKGGEGIAFRCDAIILANKQTFNAKENTLFDIISGYVSSNPDENSYIIYAKDVKERLRFASDSYVYTIMKEAAETLSDKPLLYDIELPSGDIQRVKVPWYTVLSYNNKETGAESSFVAFKPTPLFKMLLLSATVTHGAYYPVEAASKINSSYAKTIYYILESRKDYKAYPGATPGRFRFSLDELRYLVGYPAGYTSGEIKRTVLEVAKKQINALGEEIDFTFDYEMIKTTRDGGKKKFSDVEFRVIRTITAGANGKTAEEEEFDNFNDPIIKELLRAQGLTGEECDAILKKYKSNNRDFSFLSKAITSVAQSKNIENKCAVFCHIMDNGLNSKEKMEGANQAAAKAVVNDNANESSSKPGHRDYNMSDLERTLLTTDPK